MDAAARAGVTSGLMWSVSPAAADRTGAVDVQLDTASLNGVSGGGLADRLTLVQLPACALTTPEVTSCQTRTPVTTTRDTATGRLTASVTLAAGTMVLAADGTPAGSAGTFSATGTPPSNAWSQGGSTGGFNYSYPIDTPDSLGGDPADVTLSYSSQAVDGMTASTNAQASWAGDGWNYEPGYIERAYLPCKDDGIDHSGDSCWGWGGDEVSLNQSGMGGQLVHDDGTGKAWHLAGDNGAKIQLLQNTGTQTNGAYKGEYWVITTMDGTRYYYGAGHLPTAEGGTGKDPATNSALTEPIYCPKSTDPCYATSTGKASWTPKMAYRWNLDYVVDPHGNAVVYTYGVEQNYYKRSSAGTLTPYDRAGYLTKAEYGWRTTEVATQTTPAPAAQVVFSTAQRCSGSETECSKFANLTEDTKADWPDTPFDLLCKSTGTCTNYGEAYFSTLRLTQIQTQVNTAAGYKPVDTYALNQRFADPGDGTSASLWLDSITHTGNDGGTMSMPSVTFGPVQLDNRVPGSGTYPAYAHLRIADIVDETGGEISVDYASSLPDVPACDQTPGSISLPSPTANSRLCYQQYWTGPGETSAKPDWFEKYVVTEVRATDLVAGSPQQVTDYSYGGKPAWHRDDSPTTKNTERSWNQFRGFGQVTTTSGVAPDPITQSISTYLRGMDGDYPSPTGGTPRTVSVSDSLGDTVTDADQYAGLLLESDTYSAAGGDVQGKAVTLPWSAQSATHAESTPAGLPAVKAFFHNAGTAINATLLTDGTWRKTRTVNVYSSANGLLLHTDNQGDQSLVGTADSPETCITNSYATPPKTGLNAGMTAVVDRTLTVSVGANGPIGTAACPAETSANALTDTLTVFDKQATHGVIATSGNVTETDVLDHFTGNTPAYVPTTSAVTYDVYGRSTGTTNSRGLVTSMTYTPAAGLLPTSVESNDVTDAFTTTTTVDQLRQLATKSVDANGLTTSDAYDPLGRLTSVWSPGRSVTQAANVIHVYGAAGKTSPSYTETKTLRDDGTYETSFTIVNGLGQVRQTQTVTRDGHNNSVVADSFYDSHGWPVKTTSTYVVDGLPTGTPVPTADATIPGETVNRYDGRGRVVSSGFYSHANLQWQSTSAYPGADRVDSTPARGGTATTTYTDAQGRTAAQWDYTTPTPTGRAADARIITTSYYPSGKPHVIQGPGGQQWSYTYDPHGYPLTTSDPDAGDTATTYDVAGDLLTTTDGNHQLVTATFDKLGRETAEYAGPANPANQTAAYTYDTATRGKGRLATSTAYTGGSTGSSSVGYTSTIAGYDAAGAVTGTSIIIPSNVPASLQPLAGTYGTTTARNPISGSTSSVSYNADGGLPSETVNYSYNQGGVLSNLGGASTYLGSTVVDAFGRTTAWKMGVMPYQVVQTNVYDEATGRVTEQLLDRETAQTHVDDITSLYNPAGQITATRDIQDGAGTDLQCYTYNHLNQLVEAWSDTKGTAADPDITVPGSGTCVSDTPSAANIGGPAAYWQSYSYDLSGNRAAETDHDPTGDTAKDVGRTLHYPAVGSRPDELQSVDNTGPGAGTDTYRYDDTGQTVSRMIAGGAHQTFTYTADHRTATVTDTDGDTAAYTYDAAGGLLLQTDKHAGKTTTTLYLGGEQLHLTDGKVTGQRFYPTNGGPVVVRSSDGSLAYECTNSQNTSTVTIGADAGQTVTRRYFTPFGAPRGTAPKSWIDNHGFVGQPADEATGLDLLGARDYDPGSGRFLQIDPVFEHTDPNQMGGYSYAGDNPVSHADPSGMMIKADSGGGGAVGNGCTNDTTCSHDIEQKHAASKKTSTSVVLTPHVAVSSKNKHIGDLMRSFSGQMKKNGGFTHADSRFAAGNYGVDANLTEYGNEIATWDQVCQTTSYCDDDFKATMSGLHAAIDQAYDKENHRRGCFWGTCHYTAAVGSAGAMFFRSMKKDPATGKPMTADQGSRYLAPRENDYVLDEDGKILVDGAPTPPGASTQTQLKKLQGHQRPYYDGGKDSLWVISSDDVGPDLTARPDPTNPSHNMLGPADAGMTPEEYGDALQATQQAWREINEEEYLELMRIQAMEAEEEAW